MRTLVTAIQDAFTPTQAQIVAFDPDLKLAAYIEPQYLAVHIDNPSVDVGAIAAHLAKRFTSERRPPENATAHERAQWRFSGPRYFIVIDDLHLFNAPGSTMASRLMPALEPVIERGRQMGVHVMASLNGTGWAASSAHNKVVTAMDRAGAGVLILDGTRADGVIVDGVRAAPRAPGRGELVYRKLGRQLMQVALPPAGKSLHEQSADSW